MSDLFRKSALVLSSSIFENIRNKDTGTYVYSMDGNYYKVFSLMIVILIQF